jgi:hypothetical protein
MSVAELGTTLNLGDQRVRPHLRSSVGPSQLPLWFDDESVAVTIIWASPR